MKTKYTTSTNENRCGKINSKETMLIAHPTTECSLWETKDHYSISVKDFIHPTLLTQYFWCIFSLMFMERSLPLHPWPNKHNLTNPMQVLTSGKLALVSRFFESTWHRNILMLVVYQVSMIITVLNCENYREVNDFKLWTFIVSQIFIL